MDRMAEEEGEEEEEEDLVRLLVLFFLLLGVGATQVDRDGATVPALVGVSDFVSTPLPKIACFDSCIDAVD